MSFFWLCTIIFSLSWQNFSSASKVMLKILPVRLQQYMNHELPDVQAGFRKGRGTRDQIADICWIIGKAREFQKNIYFCFTDYAKAFDCVGHNKLWKIRKEMGIPDHLTCLLTYMTISFPFPLYTGMSTSLFSVSVCFFFIIYIWIFLFFNFHI